MISRHALSFLAIFGLCRPLGAQAPFLFSCAEDTHIPAAKRQAINSVASDFAQKMLDQDVNGAFELFSEAGKANVTREQLQAQAATNLRQFELKNTSIQHTYFIELTGKSPGSVVCSTDLSKPDGWESMAAANVPEQSHVVMSAQARNNRIAFTLWLVPEHGAWKVQSFWLNVATLADKDSLQLWQAARAQESKGHQLNAFLLYASALQAANRGSNFQLGITQAILQDLSKLRKPLEMEGAPPFLWKNGDTTYKVLNIGPIAIGGKIYVTIAHEVQPWQSNEQVDGWNKELLSYFKRHFPEYSDTFAGLVARALERGTSRGYGTVEEISSAK